VYGADEPVQQAPLATARKARAMPDELVWTEQMWRPYAKPAAQCWKVTVAPDVDAENSTTELATGAAFGASLRLCDIGDGVSGSEVEGATRRATRCSRRCTTYFPWNGYPRHCQWMNSGPGGNLVEMADESPDGKLAW